MSNLEADVNDHDEELPRKPGRQPDPRSDWEKERDHLQGVIAGKDQVISECERLKDEACLAAAKDHAEVEQLRKIVAGQAERIRDLEWKLATGKGAA